MDPHWAVALAVTAALHAGFQVTVSTLVYPALAEAPAAAWRSVHDRHSRRITPLVAVVYAAALVATAGTVLTGLTAATGVSVIATGVAMGLTAALAAPIHGRLGRTEEPDPVLLHRLLVVDRLRALAAVVAALAALAASV